MDLARHSINILGIYFSDTLDWGTHVDSIINKANSLLYAFRYLNSKLSRKQFRSLISAHYISKLTYASQVWSGSLTNRLKNRLDSSFFKILRLLCRDFEARKSRLLLLEKSSMQSLRTIFFCRDAKLLHTLCHDLRPEPLAERLLSQCHFLTRLGNRPHFFDYSAKKIGRNSFINRAKYISEMIPFEWPDMSSPLFSIKIKATTPPMLPSKR